MDEDEKYLFDLRGYLVVKNALTVQQIEDLSDKLEQRRDLEEDGNNTRRITRAGSDRTRFDDPNDPAWSARSLLEWGGTYIDLIDLPTIAPYLEALLGVNYRLDHDYLNINDAESAHKLYLHGGGQGAGGPKDLVGATDGGQCYYRYSNGRFFN